MRHGSRRKRRIQQFLYFSFVFVAAGTCLPSRCLVAAASSGSAIVRAAHRQEDNLICRLLIFLNKVCLNKTFLLVFTQVLFQR
jgi:hypothetical protein